MKRTLLLSAVAVLLAACGQKGALYLPPADEGPVVITPAATPDGVTPPSPSPSPGTEPDRSAESRKQAH